MGHPVLKTLQSDWAQATNSRQKAALEDVIDALGRDDILRSGEKKGGSLGIGKILHSIFTKEGRLAASLTNNKVPVELVQKLKRFAEMRAGKGFSLEASGLLFNNNPKVRVAATSALVTMATNSSVDDCHKVASAILNISKHEKIRCKISAVQSLCRDRRGHQHLRSRSTGGCLY